MDSGKVKGGCITTNHKRCLERVKWLNLGEMVEAMPAKEPVLGTRESQRQAKIKANIREKAREHGFELCHFSLPELRQRDVTALQTWLDQGYEADMDWMGEATRLARRRDPKNMLEGVQTVVCLGMRHFPPAYSLAEANAAKQQGVMAAYAHGLDYHDVMKKRLKALARELDGMLGEHAQRVFVDTAPVLEHALAAASGLGWQGKHTLTIHPKHGSYMMLGEIFTTAVIEADEPASLHCGSCTACLDVCPTQAIVAPYVVDANRCISYLTIEYQGVIPLALRKRMGNRIYGCDDCQSICPWNRKARLPEQDLLHRNSKHQMPQLLSFLAMDDVDFREYFRKSPVKRTGRVAFLRNVCVAIGNSGDASLVAYLLPLLDDPSALIRAHGVWALGELAREDSIVLQALKRLQERESDADVLREIVLCTQGSLALTA